MLKQHPYKRKKLTLGQNAHRIVEEALPREVPGCSNSFSSALKHQIPLDNNNNNAPPACTRAQTQSLKKRSNWKTVLEETRMKWTPSQETFTEPKPILPVQFNKIYISNFPWP